MLYLILDTNIWLYIANGYNSETSKFEENGHHYKLLADLIKLRDEKKLVILINSVILKEWGRNVSAMQAEITKLKNSISANWGHIAQMKKHLSEDQHSLADKLGNEYEKACLSKIATCEKHIIEVD